MVRRTGGFGRTKKRAICFRRRHRRYQSRAQVARQYTTECSDLQMAATPRCAGDGGWDLGCICFPASGELWIHDVGDAPVIEMPTTGAGESENFQAVTSRVALLVLKRSG
jgi:hypothetical protein